MAEKGNAKKKKKAPGSRPDIATFAWLVIATGGIVGGLLLEGGEIHDIAQYTAAIIVLGGTLGAVLVATPMPVVIGATKRLLSVFFDKAPAPDATSKGNTPRMNENAVIRIGRKRSRAADMADSSAEKP